MKKGDIKTVKIDRMKLPNAAVGFAEGDDTLVRVKNALPEQLVEVRIGKKRKGAAEGKLLRVLEDAPGALPVRCSANETCGGCFMQTMSPEAQLTLKEDYILGLFKEAGFDKDSLGYEGIIPSPSPDHYRNKMEYSFGDEQPGGPLTLGMHERASFYNIVNTDGCVLTDADFDTIRAAVLAFFKEAGKGFYHKRLRKGLLRHLVVRKGRHTGEILVNLVSSSDGSFDKQAFVSCLQALPLKGHITGIIHTLNDREADAVIPEKVDVLWGEPIIHDSILGLHFKISPFSFFQVNTEGAEKLYTIVRDFARDALSNIAQKDKRVIYDLYCGTGTITQIMADCADEVVGIELVEEAIEGAKLGAAGNGITNCTFIAGDVLAEADKLTDHADLIILDPPRDGIHPKAIFKILALAPEAYVYVSCKPESLMRDIPFFLQEGYKIERTAVVDMFPCTGHVETVVLMSRVNK